MANDRAKYAEIYGRSRPATAAATGLPHACADAALSIDAMQIVPDRGAAEAARLLRPAAAPC
jgi:hypothetical protein